MATVTLVLGSILTLVFVLDSTQLSEAADSNTVCRTPVCKETAKVFQQYMDPNAKPCDDFYRFACGRFLDRTPLPRGHHEVGPFSDAIRKQQTELKVLLDTYQTTEPTNPFNKATRFYKVCKNSVLSFDQRTANMNFLRQMLQDYLGGWPLTSRNWNSQGFDMTRALAKITSQLDQSFFLTPMIIPHLTNSSKYTLILMPGSPSRGASPFVNQIIRTPDQWPQKIPDLLPQGSDSYQQANLMALIRDVACIIDPSCQTNPNLYYDVMALNSLLTGANYAFNQDELFAFDKRNFWKTHLYSAESEIEEMTFTIAKLNAAFPWIRWQEYFQILFQNQDVRIDSNFKVLVPPDEVGQLLNSFQQMTTRQLALFFGWNLVTKWGPLFSPQLRGLLSPAADQDDVCLQTVNGKLGYAVGHMYNEKHLLDSSVKEVETIVRDLKSGFSKLLDENVWMDSTTKDFARKKLSNMAASVAAPEWIKYSYAVYRYYVKFNFTDADNFVSAFKKANAVYWTNQVELLKLTVDRLNHWPIETLAMTNAAYYVPTNTMYFYSGILQFPFYQPGLPRAVNFGSFGYVAGHEITHGFDTTGGSRNHLGEVENWWSESSMKSFESRAECIVNQYGSILEPTTGMLLNGMNTIGENIADNGGIRAAFKAYKNISTAAGDRLEGMEQYTEDQLFFLSAALTYCAKTTKEFMQMQILKDEHSPNMFRAIVPLLNSEDFAKAFNCPVNSIMNPTHRCRVW